MPTTLRLSVLKVSQPIGDYYIASIRAQDLVEMSYSDVRRMVQSERDIERYLGIQRPVSTARVKQIRKYLQGRDATFPTAVILAVEEKCATFEPGQQSGGILTIRSFEGAEGDEESIPFDRVAKVIDGQHRIAAFMDEDKNWQFDFQRPFEVNVAIFVGADISVQANIFATVNLQQTKVSKNLVYDLTELAKTPSPHKTCHNVTVALDSQRNSPFFQRIKRLGSATPGREKEPLSQAAFVESLVKFISNDPIEDRNKLLDGVRIKTASIMELQKTPFRNLFLHGEEVDIAEILFNYFSAIRNKWPRSWDNLGQTGNLLPRSNAFKAFMVYLRTDLYASIVGESFGRVPTTMEFSEALRHIHASDADFTARNFAPGSSGQSMFLKLFRGEIDISDMYE
ncbi:DGQHR domain-containing protein [Acidovorax sp. Leaf78]|uniref:DGQHR domain-containing protein n=1 Tax=Acidovorax sp. Leaf78 TaxID=1736237 RepID=UPI0009E815FC|nr:DGQHR domain-containing protein [Acidovorax sp. Leaf78]